MTLEVYSAKDYPIVDSIKRVCIIHLVNFNRRTLKTTSPANIRRQLNEIMDAVDQEHGCAIHSTVRLFWERPVDPKIEEEFFRDEHTLDNNYIFVKIGDEWVLSLKMQKFDLRLAKEKFKAAMEQNYEKMVQIQEQNEKVVEELKSQNDKNNWYFLHTYYQVYSEEKNLAFFYLKKLALIDLNYKRELGTFYAHTEEKKFRNKDLGQKLLERGRRRRNNF